MKQNFFILSFFVFMILIAGTLYANVEEVGDWWGTVTINGVSGNNGAIVETYISGNKVATAIVGEYEKDYYLIHVEGQEGNEVLFKINGFEAERANWSNEDHRLDLSVTIQESSSDNPPSSSGGGGSSSGSEDIQNTPETSSSTSSNSEETIQTQETEEQETSPGITGAVVGFLGSGKGITAIVILIILGVGVILIKSKPRKWIKKS
jgi:hypothetical protein